MRLEQLATLLEVERHKSLSLACIPLHMTQQTLSACIRSMERELGIAILKRTGRGVRFTAEGEKVLAYAREAVPGYRNLLAEFARSSPKCGTAKGAELRIYVNSLFYLACLTEMLKDFCASHPEVKIITLGAAPDFIRERLLEPEEDGVYRVGLLNVPYTEEGKPEKVFVNSSELNFIPLEGGSYHACVGKNSPLARKRELSLRALLREPLVIGAADEFNVTPLHYMLSRHGKPNIVLSSSSLNLWRDAIAANMGVGFVHDIFLDGREPFHSSLKDIVPVRIREKLWAVTGCLIAGRPQDIIEKFIAFLPKDKATKEKRYD